MKKMCLPMLLITFLVFRANAQTIRNNCPELDSIIAFYFEKVNADSIESYMQALEDMGTRFALADNRRDVSVWIKNKFIDFGYSETRLDSFQLIRWYHGVNYETWQYNVVSTYPGYERPDEVYILGGHHDAIVPYGSNPFVIAPGADDNASGTAAALEVARIMKQYGYEPEATIKFITFAAEELILKGSWHYANTAAAQNMNIKMMINNDMISHCTKPESEWAIKIFKYPGAEWVAELANYIISGFTTLGIVENYHNSANTDSWPFYANGYSAVFFHEEQFSPYYHSVNDLVINTNKHYTAEVIKVSLGMLIHENGLGMNTGIKEEEHQRLSRLSQNFPNPFSGKTTIRYSLSQPGWTKLSVFDTSNREITILYQGWQEAGLHQAIFNASNIPAGIYLFRMQTEQETATIKLVVNK